LEVFSNYLQIFSIKKLRDFVSLSLRVSKKLPPWGIEGITMLKTLRFPVVFPFLFQNTVISLHKN